MVGIKHEHTPAGSDGPLTRREQRAMLLFIYFGFVRKRTYTYR
jgi:hypothetical protein